MIKRVAIGILLILVVLPLSLLAAENTVKATVDSRKIGINDTVTLRLTVEGPDAMSARVTAAPRSADFRLVSGPNVSTQFRFINGRASTSKVLSYVFMPTRQGQLNLPGVSLQVGDRTFTSQPVAVEVVAGSVAPSGGNRRSADPLADLFDRGTGTDRRPADVADDVFLRLEAPKTTLYVGETTGLALLIYYRVSVTGVELQQKGGVEGIGFEQQNLSGTRQLEERQVNGKIYKVQPVMKWVLYPSRPGQFDIAPWVLRIGVETSSGSFFGFGRPQVIQRRSNTLALTIRDYPRAGRPADFAGLCGRFRLDASMDKTRVTAGEGVTMRVTLSGTGNFRDITELALPPVDGIKVYTPKVRDNIQLQDGVPRGSRTWEFVLVPIREGRVRIPAVELVAFDPADGQYHRLKTRTIDLDVSPGAVAESTPTAGTGPVPLERKGQDIRFIHAGAELSLGTGRPLFRRTWFVALFPLVIVVAGLIMVIDERRRRVRSDTRSWARSRAGLRARKALRHLEKTAGDGISDAFVQGLVELWLAYLGDRFAISRIDVTANRLRRHLTTAEIDGETVDRLLELLNRCEGHRYAPAVLEQTRPAELVTTTRDLLARLEGGTI